MLNLNKYTTKEDGKKKPGVERLKLKDGEEAQVIFLSGPEKCITLWDNNKPTRLEKWAEGARTTYLFNVYNTASKRVEILELGKRTLDLIAARIGDKASTEVVKISRFGEGTNTLYMVDPAGPFPKDVKKAAESAEQYDLADMVKPSTPADAPF